jgi:diacylglycerol kinase (ATP)
MTPLLAIANADAGTSSDEAITQVMNALGDAYDAEIVHTASPDQLEDVLAARPGLDVVVVLGGDGSLHAVVEALHAAGRLGDVTVGLVPLGTGNDFAATLGLPDDPAQAAAVIVDGRRRRVDLLLDEEQRVVVNAAHIGIGAEATAAAAPWKKALGPPGYAIGAVLSAFSTPGARLEVRVDGEAVLPRSPIIQVAVGNGRYVGGGTALLPDADPFDGRLDLAVSYAAPLARRLAYAWHLRRGEHHRSDDVVYRQGIHVSVRGDALRCTSDGELSGPSPIHSWRIEPGALRVFVP